MFFPELSVTFSMTLKDMCEVCFLASTEGKIEPQYVWVPNLIIQRVSKWETRKSVFIEQVK